MKPVLMPRQPRQLVAAYKFNEKTFVWRCDHCAKMFFVEVEEALCDEVPRMILREFEHHLCAFATAAGVDDFAEDLRKIGMFRQDDKAPEGGPD